MFSKIGLKPETLPAIGVVRLLAKQPLLDDFGQASSSDFPCTSVSVSFSFQTKVYERLPETLKTEHGRNDAKKSHEENVFTINESNEYNCITPTQHRKNWTNLKRNRENV